jgi:hypothetical protein
VLLRPWMFNVLPFLSRWQDAAPATCCGMCGPCLTAGATGLSLEGIGAKKPDEADSP